MKGLLLILSLATVSLYAYQGGPYAGSYSNLDDNEKFLPCESPKVWGSTCITDKARPGKCLSFSATKPNALFCVPSSFLSVDKPKAKLKKQNIIDTK